jgi:kynurenine 3-monooxygenase
MSDLVNGKGDIVVCGAGLVGSLMGYILQKRGYNVTIYERYGDIRQIPSLGRSINLVLTGRGLRAIDAIGGGLREEILALCVPVTGRVMHQEDSSTQYQPYGKNDSECNYSISRCVGGRGEGTQKA